MGFLAYFNSSFPINKVIAYVSVQEYVGFAFFSGGNLVKYLGIIAFLSDLTINRGLLAVAGCFLTLLYQGAYAIAYYISDGALLAPGQQDPEWKA
jgi:hypothetical protein